MSEGLLTALISASAAIVVTALTLAFNRRLQFDAAWRSEKLSYYKALIDAHAMIIGDGVPESAHQEFGRASNNLLLIAPPSVLAAHHAYRDHASEKNEKRDYDKDGLLLAALINAIRDDLRIKGLDEITVEQARLWRVHKAR